MTPLDRAQEVLGPPALAAIFLTVTVRRGREAEARDALADVPGLVRAVGFRSPESGLTCVVGVGAEAWDRLYGAPRPPHLHPFVPLHGPRHHAPGTPGDLLFHVRAARPDLCFDLCRELMDRLAGLVDCVDEVHGFRYWDERDLLGFVDGTENPPWRSAAGVDAVVVGGHDGGGDGGDGPWAGASYVVVQKYLHDLGAWDALSVEDQERVIGRRKLSDVELPDEVKPADSHVAVTTIVDPDGTERQIVRDNMAFGAVGAREFGTYFIGYAADPWVVEEMLRRMFLGDADATHDRILDFSVAATGCLFFVPPADFLEDPEPFLAASGTTTGTTTGTTSDGSLGVGSLRDDRPDDRSDDRSDDRGSGTS